eukprot:CAMPEP_0117523228 /NCGR_PEP_ID=MMETSP0784-20121206/34620_1 /TAXON_ID=39447 /ORGANISM="" /LENGTH=127 /DNA_ID=CAMNT_0005319335 /DNA_START=553 /DNA_END=933 /DNA_ORIENTATION=+
MEEAALVQPILCDAVDVLNRTCVPNRIDMQHHWNGGISDHRLNLEDGQLPGDPSLFDSSGLKLNFFAGAADEMDMPSASKSRVYSSGSRSRLTHKEHFWAWLEHCPKVWPMTDPALEVQAQCARTRP